MPRRLAIVGPYEVQLMHYDEDALQPGQVRVQTEWASGKHGTTTAMFEGGAFGGQRFDQETRLFVADEDQAQKGPTPEAPWSAGTTGVGTITEAAPDVTAWRVGDRVFGLMDVRETNTCRQDRIWALGDIEPTLALCIEPAYVAFHSIRESHVRFGDSVAVIGLGALGLLALRMAVQAGAQRVFACDPLPGRRAWAAAHGADAVLDPVTDDVAWRIHEMTDAKGVDVAIELSGTYAGLGSAIRAVRVGGTVCSAGFYQPEAHGIWLGREWHHNRLTMIVPHGCGWGHPPRDYPLWDEQRAYDCLADMMRQGKLSAPGLVHPIVRLEEMPRVFQLIRDQPDAVIKYAVRF